MGRARARRRRRKTAPPARLKAARAHGKRRVTRKVGVVRKATGPRRAPRTVRKARVGRKVGAGRQVRAGQRALGGLKVPVRRRARDSPSIRVPRPTPAEMRLLELAQEVGEIARDGDGHAALSAALTRLAAAYAPSASLPRLVFNAWVRSRDDKTATLALAWAREQVRLGLQEVVERTLKAGRGRVDLEPETIAWLLLAGCEALAQEPPSAVADRLRALLQLIGRDSASG